MASKRICAIAIAAVVAFSLVPLLAHASQDAPNGAASSSMLANRLTTSASKPKFETLFGTNIDAHNYDGDEATPVES